MTKPIEYQNKEIIFCNTKFYIDERAYIPNVETEQLVNLVAQEAVSPSVIVDVGTGSGCIAISLAKAFPKAKMYAIDIDRDALEVAQRNVHDHGIKNVICKYGCYVDDLSISSPDIIVANLPWGDENSLLRSNTPEKLAYEPSIAVFHPGGILGAYIDLIASIQKKQWHTTLYFESGVIPKEKVKKIIPAGLKWKYFDMENYSVTKIVFT